MHVNHIPKWSEVRNTKIYTGFLERFYSPYMIIMWVICMSNYIKKYIEIETSLTIQIAYSILASCHHTVIKKNEWDRDMHILESTTTNLIWLSLIDFICNFCASYCSIFLLHGMALKMFVPVWFSAIFITLGLHIMLYICYNRIVKKTMRRYASISEKI